MCMRKLKIGFDCDDVLYKCNSYVVDLENMKRRAEGKDLLDIRELTSYDATGGEFDVRFNYFKTAAFYECQPLIEGAVECVNELLDMGHEIVIISSLDSKFRSIRTRRISEDFPRIKPDNIFIVPRKDFFSVDVMLDDAIHNLQGDRAVNTPFPVLMEKPWNQDCRGIMSVKNHSMFVDLVRKIEYSTYLDIGFNFGNIFNLKYVMDENRMYDQTDDDEALEPCKLISYEEMMKRYCLENV